MLIYRIVADWSMKTMQTFQRISLIETNGNLEDVVAYKNQTGASYATSVRDILTHLALHGQYHRGQINTILRSAGGEPVNVDYITYIRELS
ncbi:hypothetical protein GCM10010911_05370 [Paenibacillus nasutitermitis]|uniref:Damage-inducible protein DinB n=2 Tax=Paenibacillus nasutitermitis TaxID=1652958 RepID=A0A917DM82_9BACL|nr:hypothetical protein GCM10010911_05370 [Paenibacillus nasutitermitis]